MKKNIFVIAIAALAVFALGVAGYTYAQAQTPNPTPVYGPGMMGVGHGHHGGMMGDQDYGTGMMGGGFGYGMMGAAVGDHPGAMGALHEYMFPAMATALGLTPEEFDARHEAGETFWDIAEAQGFSSDEAWVLMQTARDEALQKAIADGVVTQEFADQMLAHMEGMHGDGFGPGSGHCNDGN